MARRGMTKGAGQRGGGGARRRAAGGEGAGEYEAVRTAQLESMSRLDSLLSDIYAQHGLAWSMKIFDRPRWPLPQDPGTARLRTLLSTRHLVLELWDFDSVYRAHYEKVMGGLEVEDMGGIHGIVGGHGSVTRLLDDMRNKFVAHAELGLGEFAERVNAVGLAQIVAYARAVLMLQDAIYRVIPNKHGYESSVWAETVGSFGMPAASAILALKRRYEGVSPIPDRDRRSRECEALRGLQVALATLREGFCEAVSGTSDSTMDSYIRLESHVHMAKYMILDMHNFILELGRVEPGVPRPGFLAREGLYASLRNNYAAHTRAGRVSGVKELLEGNPPLLDNMVLDMVEADILADRLLGRLPGPDTWEITPMTGAQISEIEREVDDVRLACHRFYGYRYFQSRDEAKVWEARRLAKRDLGMG